MNWWSRLSEPSIFNCFSSVDGTDCPIQEPSPFNSCWYSHKFKGPGVRYEVGLSISTARLIWVHGPFPCGSFPDLKIFRLGMKRVLRPGEKVLADNGYSDTLCVIPKTHPDSTLHKRIRARHEIFNGKIKRFFIVSHTFRHPLQRHADCFYAAAHLTSLQMEEEPFFSV